MKLTRYKIFDSYLRADDTIAKAASAIALYRFFDGKWYDYTDAVIEDEAECKKLARILNAGTVFKQISSPETYFPIKDLASIVVVLFHSNPKQNTRDKVLQKINACLQQANHQYRATHNILTGLLNKDAFHKNLCEEIGSLNFEQGSKSDVSGDVGKESIAVYVCDIDFFKQVNDTFGHAYGDLVLKCVAIRMEALANDVAAKVNNRIKIVCSHPSGEEFQILIKGAQSVEEEIEVADRIRSQIGEKPLPDEDEWREMSPGIMPTDFKLPHSSERRIAISSGGANLSITSKVKDLDSAVSSLLHQADVALYRAKASGRGRTIHFNNILSEHGRVLEHHTSAEIVAIDIGGQVNVHQGQEFKVYHPNFIGGVPFVFKDGRTERRLGTYPRIPMGRLEVLNVQSEISFCAVREKQGDGFFPVGAYLEAVPVGEFTHLLQRKEPLPQLDELQQEVDKRAAGNKPFTVIVVGVVGVDELLKEKGSGYVNQAFADLYNELDKLSGGKSLIGNTTTVGIALITSDVIKKEDCQKLLDRLAQKYRAHVRFSVGMAPASGYDKKYLLTLARMAANTAALREQDAPEVFGDSTAASLISSRRSLRQFTFAREEYQTLSEMGLNTAEVDNHAALVEHLAGDLDGAVKLLDLALSKSPTAALFHSNKAFMLYEKGDKISSYRSYLSAEAIDHSHPRRSVHLPRYALAAYEFARVQNDVDAFLRAKELVGAALIDQSVPEKMKYQLQIASLAIPGEIAKRSS